MIKHWIIKNHDGDFLVGFHANGNARWRLSVLEVVVYSTEDLCGSVLPALAKADVDVFTVERHS